MRLNHISGTSGSSGPSINVNINSDTTFYVNYTDGTVIFNVQIHFFHNGFQVTVLQITILATALFVHVMEVHLHTSQPKSSKFSVVSIYSSMVQHHHQYHHVS